MVVHSAGAAWASWLIVLGLSLGPAASNGLARFAYGLILPAMRQDLAWSYTQAGWANTANGIGYLVGALWALRTIGIWGARALFISGLILTTLALVASGLTRDFWWFSLSRVLAGIGGAPVFIAGGAMVSTLFRDAPAKNALAIAIYFGGGGLGMMLTGLSMPLMIDDLGPTSWQFMWLLLGNLSAIAAVPAVCAALYVPVPPSRPGDNAEGGLSVDRMLPSLLGYFLFGVGYIVYMTFLVAWMRDQGAEAPMVARTWGVLGAAVMLSPLAWRGVLARSSGGGALALVCAATACGTILPQVWPQVWPQIWPGADGLLLSAAIFGVSFFMGPAAVTSFSRKNLPEAQWGRAVALYTTVFALGQTIGPVAAGFIADATKSLSLGLSAAGGTLLLAAFTSAFQRALAKPA
jgi:MFS family permease